MIHYKLPVLILLLPVVIRRTDCSCKDDQRWMRQTALDSSGQMTLKWNFTDTDITFLLKGRTKGWMAIGLSPSGDTNGTDYYVGWVQNGKVKLQDRYSVNESEPLLDKDQSLTIIGGNEDKNATIICFKRKIKTCDRQDINIPKYIVYVFWAYSKSDPKELSYGNLQFEKATKGKKITRLLAKLYPKPSMKGVETVDILSKNITLIPSMGRTLYWCSHMKLPPSQVKRYLIGVEPVIQPSNEGIVHHNQLYICPSEIFEKLYDEIDPSGYNCFDEKMIKYQNPCIEVISAWALGQDSQFYPSGIATSLRDDDTSTIYFKLEVHYDIPPNKKGVKDQSGLRLYTTQQKPKYDAGVLSFGVWVGPYQLIPPGQKAFSNIGLCDPKCLKNKFPSEGITMFSIDFHAHLAAKQLILHRFRNGKEMEPLEERHFDPMFQGYFFPDKEVKFLADDQYVVECVYDTSQRNYTTVGGFPTNSEMCIVFINYYPRVDITWCNSILMPEEVYNLTGIEKVGSPPGIKKCEGPKCSTPLAEWGATPVVPILEPSEFANKTVTDYMMVFKNWTSEKVETLKKMNYGNQLAICKDNRGTFYSTEKDIIKYPKSATPYAHPDSCTKS